MRAIDTFSGNEANASIEILADEPGPGGVSHEYRIGSINVAPSDSLGLLLFQKGAIKEVGKNGITDEAVISVLMDRLRGFQSGPFSCRQNALALTKLEEAMHWLNDRTADRVARGVEGLSKA